MIRFANLLIDEKEIVACVLDSEGSQKITLYFNCGQKLDVEGTLADRIWDYLGGYNSEADEKSERKDVV